MILGIAIGGPELPAEFYAIIVKFCAIIKFWAIIVKFKRQITAQFWQQLDPKPWASNSGVHPTTI